MASAGPIRISILANASQAVQEVTGFRKTTEDNVQRVVTTMSDPKLEGAFGRAQEGFDLAEQRALGFQDTISGIQNSFVGFRALMGQGEMANASFGDKLATVGMGISDLAGGMANFVIPMLLVITNMNRMALASARSTVGLVAQRVAMVAAGVATRTYTAAQWLLNAAMSANPVGLIILAIVALVAVIVIAWKKSETFRRIVMGAFEGVQKAAAAVWNWIKGNWPLLLAIITGPIGLAVLWVIRNFDRISAAVKAIPGIIKSAFINANVWLINAGRAVVEGMWAGISGAGSWIWGKITSFVSTFITGPIERALGIASPSKVGKGIGRWFTLGVGEGVEDASAVDRVRRAAGRLTAATIPFAPGGSSAGAGGELVISFDGAGDPLLQAILNELRKYIRVNGGSVQSVLGRA